MRHLRDGYKKSSIGYIPVEWEVKKLKELGKAIIGLTYSPIKGPEGNREYLVYFTKDKEKKGSFEMSQIDEVVKESHSQL